MIQRILEFFNNITKTQTELKLAKSELADMTTKFEDARDRLLETQKTIKDLQKEKEMADIVTKELSATISNLKEVNASLTTNNNKIQTELTECLNKTTVPYFDKITRVDSPSGKWDVSLDDRLATSVKAGAKLHISIHANAYGTTWNTACGCEGFYSTARTKELVDNIQAKASAIERNRGTKTANFFITREFPKKGIESVLFEGPFMTNKEELAKLKSDTFRKQIASTYAQGIIDYCKKYKITNISIGAGHGHETAGKRAFDDSLREWDYNSAVVLYIIETLKKEV